MLGLEAHTFTYRFYSNWKLPTPYQLLSATKITELLWFCWFRMRVQGTNTGNWSLTWNLWAYACCKAWWCSGCWFLVLGNDWVQILNSILQHSSVQNETSIISSRVEDVYEYVWLVIVCLLKSILTHCLLQCNNFYYLRLRGGPSLSTILMATWRSEF